MASVSAAAIQSRDSTSITVETGAFRGWICAVCNTGAGLADSIERLEKRIIFLRAHKKKKSRLALIKAVHEAAS
jgi:hypothetical protein